MRRTLLHLLVSEDLVTKGVEAHEGDPDVGGRHPVLQLLAVVEVVRTWGAGGEALQNLSHIQNPRW